MGSAWLLGFPACIAAGAINPRSLFVVIPIFVLIVAGIVYAGLRKRPQRAAANPGQADDRKNRIVLGVVAGIAVAAIAVILYLLETRRSDATGGPVLVIVTGVVLMALAAGHFRFMRKKTDGIPPGRLRKEAVVLATA